MTVYQPAEPKTDWSHRLKVWGGITVAVLLGLLIGAAFIPRWWAHRVGDQANESFTGGIMLGLFYGFVFTVAAAAHHLGHSPPALRADRGVDPRGSDVARPPEPHHPRHHSRAWQRGARGRQDARRRGAGFRGATLGGTLLALAAIAFTLVPALLRRGPRAPARITTATPTLGGQGAPHVPAQLASRPSWASLAFAAVLFLTAIHDVIHFVWDVVRVARLE